ncbi:MAG: transposase [Verrucomicrobia bacterium]|nr:transposase [Verrucomicrobiota bacterium]
MSLLIHDAFLSPALELLPTLEHYRQDLDYSDAEFLTLGVRRINTYHPSGRSFLQSVRQCEVSDVSLKAYFGACRSRRRLKLAHELNTAVSWQLRVPSDRFAAFPELHGRDILALDGHDIRHGSHEPAALTRRGESKVPDTLTGVFLRDLRTGGARVLTQTHGHQHEWAAVKACPWRDFLWRPEARGTILVIDPVAVDFGSCGAPSSRGLHGDHANQGEPRGSGIPPAELGPEVSPNQGVLSDERVWFSEAGEFRRIRYRDPESGTVYELLTTEFHLPPGIIAQIYRLRWDIEKFFDVCENLLAEARAWGAGPVPAQVQNEFLVLVHNLLILLSTRLEAEEGLRDEKVEVKYEAALQARERVAKSRGRSVSPWVRVLRRITRWSSQFTRWLQDALLHRWEWTEGLAKLRPLMHAYLR